MTRSLAFALRKHNINVNSYCPGKVITDMQNRIAVEVSRITGGTVSKTDYCVANAAATKIPLRRAPTIEDVALFVSYLASPAGDIITGQNIMINGGEFMI